MWGTEITFRGVSIAAKLSGLRGSREQEAGGFQMTHDAVCRIDRTVITGRPALGETFTVVASGLTYRFDEVIDNPRSPEWVLGVADISN